MKLRKTGCLLIILIAVYTHLMVYYPSDRLKGWGYNHLLDIYGVAVARNAPVRIHYNPGLRDLGKEIDHLQVCAVIPQDQINYRSKIDDFFHSGRDVIVECSGLDAWHGSSEGKAYLRRLYDRAYRVVIFDGGHHLPTLGLSPDLIIIPEFRGYAVHGYMKDAIPVDTLCELLTASKSSIILVSVPRWRLVKSPVALAAITEQVFSSFSPQRISPPLEEPASFSRVSKFQGLVFAYINRDYAANKERLVKYCQTLGLEDVRRIYLAFDYGVINTLEAREYSNGIKKALGKEVEIVNEPIRVNDLLFRPAQH